MEKEKKLSGLHIIFFESRHSKTLGDLITLQGGSAQAAPAMKEVPLENNREVLVFAEELFAGRIDLLVLLTGVGTKVLVTVLETKHSREKIFEQLKKTTIVPRGPKPIRVLKEWGIPFALTVPEPNTWRELLQTLDEHKKDLPLAGKTVAVQEYGVSNPELLEGLKERGAKVLRVPVYRWALPDDTGPLENAISKIISNEIHIAMFTTAVQAEHLFQVGAQRAVPLRNALNKIVIASIGPDCSETLKNLGLNVDIEAKNSKMAGLVSETAEKARELLHAKRIS